MQTGLKYKHIRFLGAEGIGMSALIRILERQNPETKISKSDLSYKKNDPLDDDIDLVVRSTAIADNDIEFFELKSRGLEIWHRRDMLNYLSQDFKQIVVSGTHGKTTCSAMLAYVLAEMGQDPSFAVGGILPNYNSNARAGNGQYFVLEGDESDKSFTITNPYLALVTCVEPDHLENYPGGIEEIKDCFYKFLDKAEICIVNIDDPILKEYAQTKDCIGYSESELTDYNLDLQMKGKHNAMNALGVLKACEALGLDQAEAKQALANFSGVKRRFELVNDNYNGIKVYDDYAHHPTEIEALLDGALSLKPKRLVFVYQPHHPERTKQFWDDFVKVFKQFPEEHLALIADIYVARSQHIDGIDSENLVAEINKANVKYLAPSLDAKTSQGNISNMLDALKPGIDAELEEADYLFIVGAGDIAKVVPGFRNLSENVQ